MQPDHAPYYAGVDVGTNAIRMLVACANPSLPSGLQKAMMLRVPIRLGDAVFSTGRIGKDLGARLAMALGGFAQLAGSLEVSKMRACATSAFREADDGAKRAKRASEALGVKLEVIDGNEEAMLMSQSAAYDAGSCIAIVDVGGGSTEVSIVSGGILATAETFRLGTLRLKQSNGHEAEFARMGAWLDRARLEHQPDELSGSGGNIRRVNKLIGASDSISCSRLEELKGQMEILPVSERMATYMLREDRAETIVSAMDIYMKAAHALKLDEITIRQNVGLVDGIVLSLIGQAGASA